MPYIFSGAVSIAAKHPAFWFLFVSGQYLCQKMESCQVVAHMLFSSCCRFYNKSSNYSLNEFLKQTIHKKLSTVLHLTLLKFFARGVVANIRRNIRIMKNDRSRTQIQIRPRHTVTRYGLTPCFDVFVNVLDSSHLSSSWLWLICSSIATDVAKF